MSENAVKQFLVELPHAGNEGIRRVVEELSQKAGIATPELYRSNGRHLLLEMAPAAAMRAGDEKAALVLNQKMLRHILGDGLDFAHHASITEEMKGIIAHEIGHIRRGDLKGIGLANTARFTPLAGMFGAVAGLYLIRDHQKKNKEKADKEKTLSPEAVEEALKLPADIKSPTLEAVKKVALYTVTAAAGLTAGMVAARGMRHHMEYACDAYSKELLGSGKPLAGALEKLGVFTEALNERVLKDMPEKNRAAMRSFIKIFEGMFHPPAANRVAQLMR